MGRYHDPSILPKEYIRVIGFTDGGVVDATGAGGRRGRFVDEMRGLPDADGEASTELGDCIVGGLFLSSPGFRSAFVATTELGIARTVPIIAAIEVNALRLGNLALFLSLKVAAIKESTPKLTIAIATMAIGPEVDIFTSNIIEHSEQGPGSRRQRAVWKTSP